MLAGQNHANFALITIFFCASRRYLVQHSGNRFLDFGRRLYIAVPHFESNALIEGRSVVYLFDIIVFMWYGVNSKSQHCPNVMELA